MLLQRAQKKVSMVLILVLLFTMLVPTMVSGATGVPLKDIGGSYAKNEIQSLVDRGIISGYEDGTFQPAKAMSRAEMAKILALSLNLKEQPDQASGFSDVAPSSWYRGYVGAILKYGITQGTSANTFSPDDSVTREELVVFFIRAMGLEDMAAKIPADAQLADLSTVSIWARNSVSLACKIGFVNGVEQNDVIQFSPKEKAERQALARLAYEFISNKDKFVEKANALINTTASDNITEITAVNSTSVEVSFSKDQPAVALSDFSLNGLKIVKAELKTDSRTVVVLTTDAQTAGTIYTLSYKGKDTGKTFTGLAAAMGGGGFGGGFGGGAGTGATTDLQKINAGGTYPSLTITSPGFIGPADGATTTVTGTLTLDPGADGEITLQNVRADQILVASGSSNSIKLKNTIINTLKVASSNQSNSTRIETLEGSQVTNTLIQSKVIIESTAGSLGMIQIGYGAAGQEVELRGTIQSNIIVNSSSTTIKIAPPKEGGTTSVANLNLSSQATVSVAFGTKLSNVSITSSRAAVQFTGAGQIHNLTVSKEAEGATLNLATANITSLKLEANVSLAGDAATIGSIPIIAAPGVVVTVPAGVTETLKTDAITAIAAIGAVTRYSPETEARIQAAETKANKAIILGIDPNDIPGYTTTLVDAKVAITNYALEITLNYLSIRYYEGEAQDNVTHDVVLPIFDHATGVRITWNTSSISLVTADGRVTRPEIGLPNANVTLQATLSKSDVTATKDFVLTVLARQADVSLLFLNIDPTNLTMLTRQAQQLHIFGNYSNHTKQSLTDNIIFTSSHPDIATVSSTGVVTAISRGTAEITAAYAGLVTSTLVTVSSDEITLLAASGDHQVSLYWNMLLPDVTYEIYSTTISGEYNSPPAVTQKNEYLETGLEEEKDYFFVVKTRVDGIYYTSNEVHVNLAKPLPQTSQPTVTGSVYENGWLLNGLTEPSTNDQSSLIFLTKKNGTGLDFFNVGSTGTFTLTPLFENKEEFHLEVGEEVYLHAVVDNKAWSEPIILTVQPTLGKTASPNVVDIINEDSSVTGTAEPGAIVYLQNPNHINEYPGQFRISSTVASPDGSFIFYGSEGRFQSGDELVITAAELGRGTSDPVRRIVQPAPVTEAPTVTGVVYTTSWNLSGSGELPAPNHRNYVTLKKQDGTYIAGGNIGEDGRFTIKGVNQYIRLTLTDKEVVFLTAQAYGKKESTPVPFVVQTPTVKTAQIEVKISNQLVISGSAEQGSVIKVFDHKNNTSFITYASPTDGLFLVDFQEGRYLAGDQLSITATAIGQETSEAVLVTIQPAPVTDTPTVAGSVYTNSWLLDGTSEPTVNDAYTRITLSKKDGTKVSSNFSERAGTFRLTSRYDFYPLIPLTAGEELLLTATTNGKLKSQPIILTVQPTVGQTAAPVITNMVNEVSDIIGTAEPGATVYLKSNKYANEPSGNNNSSLTIASEQGYFMFRGNEGQFSTGEQLIITAGIIGKAISEPVSITVEAAQSTMIPTVTGSVYTNSWKLKGYAEPNTSGTYCTVNLTKQDGTYIATAYIETDGSFIMENINYNPDLRLTDKEVVFLTAQVNGKKKSNPVPLVVQAPTVKTAQVVLDVNNEVVITGSADFGSIIKAVGGSENRPLLGYASPATGSFRIDIPESTYSAGDQLSITASKIGQETSEATLITLQPAPVTTAPTVSGEIYTNGWLLEGTSEASSNKGEYTKITLSKRDGTLLSVIPAEPSGRFKLVYYNGYDLPSRITAGEELLLTATADGKLKSQPIVLVALPTVGQTVEPVVTNNVNEVTNIVGTAEPGAIVYLQSVDHGNEIPGSIRTLTTVASADGSFSYYGYEGQFNGGDELTLTAEELGKGISNPVHVTVQAAPLTATPEITGNVYTNGWKLQGFIEPNTSNTYSYVSIRKQNNSYVTEAIIERDGQFTLEGIDYNQNLSMNVGDVLILTAKVEGKKKSNPVNLTVQAPLVKTSKVMLDVTNDVLITGWAEYGSYIFVVGSKDTYRLTTRASKEDGSFVINTDRETYLAGDQVSIFSTVVGQETSDAVSVILQAAPVTKAPIVTGNIYPNSINLTGTMELGTNDAYTSVTLSKSNGSWSYGDSNRLGTFRMFSLLEGTLANLTVGEELLLTATAYGKKQSEPVRITVSSTSGQTAQPTQLEVKQALITGKTDPDAFVGIFSSNGSRIFTTSAYKDGTFSVDTSWYSFQVGDVLSITATSIGKATSEPVQAIVQASPKTLTPTVMGTIYTNMYMLNGTIGESDYVNIFLGTSQVGSFTGFGGWNGEFSSSNLVMYYSLVAGEEVLVTAQTNGKLRSDPVRMTVKATEGKTEIPTYKKLTQDNYLDGTAEPGAIIKLDTDTPGRYSTVSASVDGTYSLYVHPDFLKPGSQLSLTATVLGKATSDTVHITIAE